MMNSVGFNDWLSAYGLSIRYIAYMDLWFRRNTDTVLSWDIERLNGKIDMFLAAWRHGRQGGLSWLECFGVARPAMDAVIACIPGEDVSSGGYYVNTATPGVFYLGQDGGALPLVAGRWYLLPGSATREGSGPVGMAVSLLDGIQLTAP